MQNENAGQKEIKIDEMYITVKIANFIEMVESILKDIDILKDTKKDIFDRFLSLNRLDTISEMASAGLKISKLSLVRGFNLHDERLNTQMAKDNGWNKPSTEKDPFFTQNMQESEEFAELIARLKGERK